MKIIKEFLKVLFLDFAKYPNVDLQNQSILNKQFNNIDKFAMRRLFLYVPIVVTCFELIGFVVLTKIFAIDVQYGSVVDFQMIFLFFMGILIVISFITFRCPNCGTIPKGRSFSLGPEVSYSKGLHPFPKRCECCGFFLSKKALLRELQKIRNVSSSERDRT